MSVEAKHERSPYGLGYLCVVNWYSRSDADLPVRRSFRGPHYLCVDQTVFHALLLGLDVLNSPERADGWRPVEEDLHILRLAGYVLAPDDLLHVQPVLLLANGKPALEDAGSGFS